MIDYDNTATYQKGDYCMYNNSLYVANQNIDTAEEFDSSHWDETSVINELEALNKSNIYSTTEQRIGTWIDGKPIYRRVYTGTTPNATSGIIGNVPNIEQAVKILGLYNMAGYWTNFEGGISTLNVIVQIQKSTGDLYYAGPSDSRNKPYILIIEYTKTTD